MEVSFVQQNQINFAKTMGHKTTPYTPQKNGVVERLNRTLMEKAKKHVEQCWSGADVLG